MPNHGHPALILDASHPHGPARCADFQRIGWPILQIEMAVKGIEAPLDLRREKVVLLTAASITSHTWQWVGCAHGLSLMVKMTDSVFDGASSIGTSVPVIEQVHRYLHADSGLDVPGPVSGRARCRAVHRVTLPCGLGVSPPSGFHRSLAPLG